MTTKEPNWWNEEPYLEWVSCKFPAFHQFNCVCPSKEYNIEAIIEERKETTAKILESDGIQSEWSCGTCKSKLNHTKINGNYCLWCGAKFI